MTRKPHRSHKRRAQEGAAALEFALVLPLLVILLFGMIDFGYLMFIASTMNNAAREGARAGAVVTVDTSVESTAKQVAEAFLDLNGLGPTKCKAPNCVITSTSFSAGNPTAVPKIPRYITVSVQLPSVKGISGFTYNVLPGVTSPFGGTWTLKANSQMRWELSP